MQRILFGVALALGMQWPALAPGESTESPPSGEVTVIRPGQNWKNALARPGGTLLNLRADDANPYRIFIPEKPTPQERQAAADLQSWLRQATGLSLEVIPESGQTTYSGREISVGETRLKKEKKIESPPLGKEGYQIAVSDKALFFSGGPERGPLFAVYSFLEEDLGLRWYPRFSEGKRGMYALIPETLSGGDAISVVPRSYSPPFAFRSVLIQDSINYSATAILNKLNSLENYPSWYGPTHAFPPKYFIHTYRQLVPADLFKTQPELFSLVKGARNSIQICPMNAKVREMAVERIREVLNRSQTKCVNISPNDSELLCECQACSAVNWENASRNAANLDFVNYIARTLKPEFPDVMFWTTAYWSGVECPTKIRPESNVAIFLCNDTHTPKFPFHYISETAEFQKLVSAWLKVTQNIFIWDYVLNMSHYIIPFPNLDPIADNLKWYRDAGIRGGVMLQGNYQSYGGERDVLRTWVWAKQLWNPDLATGDLVNDFCNGYFGKAGEPMAEYNALLHEIWAGIHETPLRLQEDHDHGLVPVTDGDAAQAAEKPASATDLTEYFSPAAYWLNDDFLRSAGELFDRAEALAKGDSDLTRRIRQERLPLLYVELGRYLGYLVRGGTYVYGARSREDSQSRQDHLPRYERLFEEFAQIVRENGVTHVGEASSPNARRLLDSWKAILTGDREKVDFYALDNRWLFRKDPRNVGLKERWFAPESDPGQWEEIDITDASNPSRTYLGVSWFRQEILVSEKQDNKGGLFLLFGAVDEDAEIFIDGRKIAEHSVSSTGLPPEEIWNTPFVIDLRKYVRSDTKSSLVVRVYNRERAGGIIKPVFFVSKDGPADPTKLSILSQGSK